MVGDPFFFWCCFLGTRRGVEIRPFAIDPINPSSGVAWVRRHFFEFEAREIDRYRMRRCEACFGLELLGLEAGRYKINVIEKKSDQCRTFFEKRH